MKKSSFEIYALSVIFAMTLTLTGSLPTLLYYVAAHIAPTRYVSNFDMQRTENVETFWNSVIGEYFVPAPGQSGRPGDAELERRRAIIRESAIAEGRREALAWMTRLGLLTASAALVLALHVRMLRRQSCVRDSCAPA